MESFLGFAYAGVQAGYACLCGNNYGKIWFLSQSPNAKQAAPETIHVLAVVVWQMQYTGSQSQVIVYTISQAFNGVKPVRVSSLVRL